MAIIKCPECGHDVSDKATSCPHCGFNISTLKHCEECNAIISESEANCPNCGSPTPWSRKCPECGNYVLPSVNTCPECGFDMEAHYGRVNTIASDSVANPLHNTEMEYSMDEDIEKTSKKKWIIATILLVVFAAAAWWFIGGGSNPTMRCEILDNHGTIYGTNDKPICAATMYSGSEPFHITFDSSVDMFGKKVTDIYCRESMVFTEYPYPSQISSLTPIAKYNIEKMNGKWTFIFTKYDASKTTEIPLERKLREATTTDEVKKLLNGTTWHCLQNDRSGAMSWWTQVKFEGDNFICYTANPSDGHWTEAGRGSYKIGEGRFANTGEPYIYLSWNADGGKVLGGLTCEYLFIPTNRQFEFSCRTLQVVQGDWYGDPIVEKGTMILGDYKW